MFIYRVVEALAAEKVAYAVVGGYAVALHGAVRGTLDLDLALVISLENFLAAEKAMARLGLQSRIPVTAKEVFQFREEFIQKKNLIAWSFCNPDLPTEVVDLILPFDLRKMKTVQKKIGRRVITVLAIEDLIQMKKKAGRPQDLADVRALEKLQK